MNWLQPSRCPSISEYLIDHFLSFTLVKYSEYLNSHFLSFTLVKYSEYLSFFFLFSKVVDVDR